MRWAMKRWAVGLSSRSAVAMAYQDGLEAQAGGPDREVSAFWAIGRWATDITSFTWGGRSAAYTCGNRSRRM